MLLVAIVSSIIRHHGKKRDARVGRSPQRACSVERISVRLQVHAYGAGAPMNEGRAHGCAETIAEAPATVTTKKQPRLVPIPQALRPAAKSPAHQQPGFFLDRLPDFMGQARRRDGSLVP